MGAEPMHLGARMAEDWTVDNKVGNVGNASVELLLPLEDADGESTANKSKK
jgi:hypothetical protein